MTTALVISWFILCVIIVLGYVCAIKMIYEHKKLHKTKSKKSLDLPKSS